MDKQPSNNNYQANPSQSMTPFDLSKIIDIEKAQKNLGMEELYYKLLDNFAQQILLQNVEKMSNAVDSQNMNDLKFYAHNLKGACGYIGVGRLYQACGMIENLFFQQQAGQEELIKSYQLAIESAIEYIIYAPKVLSQYNKSEVIPIDLNLVQIAKICHLASRNESEYLCLSKNQTYEERMNIREVQLMKDTWDNKFQGEQGAQQHQASQVNSNSQQPQNPQEIEKPLLMPNHKNNNILSPQHNHQISQQSPMFGQNANENENSPVFNQNAFNQNSSKTQNLQVKDNQSQRRSSRSNLAYFQRNNSCQASAIQAQQFINDKYSSQNSSSFYNPFNNQQIPSSKQQFISNLPSNVQSNLLLQIKEAENEQESCSLKYLNQNSNLHNQEQMMNSHQRDPSTQQQRRVIQELTFNSQKIDLGSNNYDHNPININDSHRRNASNLNNQELEFALQQIQKKQQNQDGMQGGGSFGNIKNGSTLILADGSHVIDNNCSCSSMMPENIKEKCLIF
eukprot:403348147